MTYKEEWKDFIQRELITSSFKTESELKECYEKAFETNKSVVEFLIGYELSNLLQAEFTIIINKDSVVVNYSKSNSSKEIFVMPCNYYGCQIDHEYIYGKFDEVVPYVIYFILQKYSIKFAQLGLYYIPPKRKKNFGYEFTVTEILNLVKAILPDKNLIRQNVLREYKKFIIEVGVRRKEGVKSQKTYKYKK